MSSRAKEVGRDAAARPPSAHTTSTTPIEDGLPGRWTDLQEAAGRILRECGLDVTIDHPLSLARGTVNVDVYARDGTTSPASTTIVECKLWRRRVPKQAVHGFRTVVIDAGANLGLLVSAAGFQRGAAEAVEHTNVRLVNWVQFQELYTLRWFRSFFAPTLRREADALVQYTEPINTRIFGKADRLPAERQAEFKRLRETHSDLGTAFILLLYQLPDGLGLPDTPVLPSLPLRRLFRGIEPRLPGDVLDATALRTLLDLLIGHFRAATAEFDAVFGERA